MRAAIYTPFPITFASATPTRRGVGARIRETIDLLAAFPDIGHEGALPGAREMVVPGLPYIIVHRMETGDEKTLAILGVYHGAQRRPGQET